MGIFVIILNNMIQSQEVKHDAYLLFLCFFIKTFSHSDGCESIDHVL